jgi:hypothetical protein
MSLLKEKQNLLGSPPVGQTFCSEFKPVQTRQVKIAQFSRIEPKVKWSVKIGFTVLLLKVYLQ